eukprot:c18019_g1_i1 orf=1-261(-)
MQRDSKAEEAIAAFFVERRRAEISASDGDDKDFLVNQQFLCSQQDVEWKGNVMFVNHSANPRRPPASAINELDKADELYLLGHTLRE